MQYIAFDSHKQYTLASVEPATGGPAREAWIPHGFLFLLRSAIGKP